MLCDDCLLRLSFLACLATHGAVVGQKRASTRHEHDAAQGRVGEVLHCIQEIIFVRHYNMAHAQCTEPAVGVLPASR